MLLLKRPNQQIEYPNINSCSRLTRHSRGLTWTRRWRSSTKWRKPMESKKTNNVVANVPWFLTILFSYGQVWTKVRVNVWMGSSEKYKLPNDVINCTVILFPSETPDEYNCHANTLKVRTNCLGANMQVILKLTPICTRTNMYRLSHTDLLTSKTIECDLCGKRPATRVWKVLRSGWSLRATLHLK